MSEQADFSELDRRIILATQAGLPLDPQPYQRLAEGLGVTAASIQGRLAHMLADGRIRRIAAVPNHYRLGYVANGMSVWDIPDGQVDRVGEQVGNLDFVSHCYRRPRYLPEWPYNFFAMVHGHSQEEVHSMVGQIAGLLDGVSRGHEVLFSTRILKKTGMRFASKE